jgi:hypothetical protein
MLTINLAKDNDYDGYLENLADLLTLSVFLSVANTQVATAIHANLTVVPVYGTYTIPASATSPERVGVVAYKFTLEGHHITTHAGAYVGTPIYLMVREAQNLRRWAEVNILEDLPLEGPGDA